MRTLLTLGSMVIAMLVPWNSLAPTWLPDASGSPVRPNAEPKGIGLVVRLNPSLGIVPLPADSSELAATESSDGDSGQDAFQALSKLIAQQGGPERESCATGGMPSGVICENGVCRVVDSPGAESSPRLAGNRKKSTDSPVGGLTWEQARTRLDQLGAAHFRLEHVADSDEFRFCCSVRVSDRSQACRRFEATAASDMQAVEDVLQQIDETRQNRP